MWLIVAFAALGLLIGNLVGLSDTPVVSPLLGLVFAFAGGSVIAFLHKLTESDRKAASQALLALSVSCLIGVYGGVTVNEYRLLTPEDRRWPAIDTARATRDSASALVRAPGYLRSAISRRLDEIDARYQNRELTAVEAYDSLHAAIRSLAEESDP